MKKIQEEHVNRERWLVSYADFITLLFAFFVVMYAISSVNEGKYRVLSKSLETAFQEPVRSIDPEQIGEIIKFQKNVEEILDEELSDLPKFELLSEDMRTTLEGLIQEGLVVIKENKDWIEIEMKSDLLFRSGSASLPSKGIDAIRQVANIFKNFENPITVEGYTDNRPIYNDLFFSNWELSANRAAAIAGVLVAQGIEAERVSAVAYGENFPIADNNTRAGRARNRRVVFLINKKDLRKEELKKASYQEKDKDGIVIRKEKQQQQAPAVPQETKSSIKMITKPDGSKEFVVEDVLVPIEETTETSEQLTDELSTQ